MRVVVCVDDVHPETGWGNSSDSSMHFMQHLHETYGVRFTLFIPANYHKKYPLSQYSGWLSDLYSSGMFELAAHGLYHDTSNFATLGECEFFELTSPDEINRRLDMIFDEWYSACKIIPSGWRSPGWLCSKESCEAIDKRFKYVAIHYQHNNGLEWNNAIPFYGHDDIQSTDISLHNGDMIMFQSHINGSRNRNNWTKSNYMQLEHSIKYLIAENSDIEFVTLDQCI